MKTNPGFYTMKKELVPFYNQQTSDCLASTQHQNEKFGIWGVNVNAKDNQGTQQWGPDLGQQPPAARA